MIRLSSTAKHSQVCGKGKRADAPKLKYGDVTSNKPKHEII